MFSSDEYTGPYHALDGGKRNWNDAAVVGKKSLSLPASFEGC